MTTTPIGRTEQDVAAETIAILIDARVIRYEPVAISRASQATGVKVAAIKRAVQLREWVRTPLGTAPVRPGAMLQPSPPVLPAELAPAVRQAVEPVSPARQDDEPPASEPAPEATTRKRKQVPRGEAKLQKWNEAQRRKKEPEPGIRICSDCGPKPKERFSPKDKSGKLRWICDDCYRDHQRARYLSVKRMKGLGITLSFVLELDDALAGTKCEKCSRPCEVGEEVVARTSKLRHAACQAIGQ